MVYIAKKGNEAVFHTGLQAMRDFDGIETPEMTLTEEEFEAAGSLVRVINGTLVLGKSDAELNAEKAADRLREINAELRSIDAKSGRPARAAAAAVAKGLPPDPADVPRLEEYDQRSASLRSELNTVQSGVAG